MSIAIPQSLQSQLNHAAVVLFTDMLAMKPSQRILTPEQRADSLYDHRPCTELVELDTLFDQRMTSYQQAFNQAIQADREYRTSTLPQVEAEYKTSSYKYSVTTGLALNVLEMVAVNAIAGQESLINSIAVPLLVALGTLLASVFVGKKIAVHKARSFLEEQHPQLIRVMEDIWERECEIVPKTYLQLKDLCQKNLTKRVPHEQQEEQHIRVEQLLPCKHAFKSLGKRVTEFEKKGVSIFCNNENTNKK